MGFLDAYRRRLQNPLAVPGFAGGTLSDQLDAENPQQPQQQRQFIQTPSRAMPPDQQPVPTGQMLTPANQAAITRPRTVTQSPFAQRFSQGAGAQQLTPTAVYDPNNTDTRPLRTQPRNYPNEDMEDLRTLQARPDSFRDKAGLVFQNIATNLGGHPLPTRKQRDEQKALEKLNQDVGLQREQAQVASMGMVPVSIPDGQGGFIQTTAPRSKVAGVLQGNARLANSAALNQAHIQRWDTMGAEKGREQAMREYQTGMYDDNPEMLDYLGKTYTENKQALPPVRASVTVGDQTYKVKPDTAARVEAQTTEGQANRTSRTANVATQQAGANQRAGMQQTGANLRAGMRQGQGQQRKLSGTEINKRTDLIGQIEDARQKMFDADKVLNSNAPEAAESGPSKSSARAARARAQKVGRLAAAQLNSMGAGYEAGPGTDYPYYKPVDQQPTQAAPAQAGDQYAGKRISKANVAVYGQRHQMSADDAAKYLTSQGAIIY